MALVGSIAINMRVSVAKFAKDLKAAGKAVSAFGSRAAAPLRAFGSMFGATGQAVAGVVKDFYIAPLLGFGKFLGDWGKAIGTIVDDRLVAPFKGFAGYIRDWGRAIGYVYGDRVRAMAAPLGSIAQASLGAAKATGRFGMALTKVGFRAAWAGVRGIGSAAMYTARQVDQAVRKLARFGAIAGVVAGAGVWKLIKSAGDLSEQVNRANVMFGGFSSKVQAEANQMAMAFGVSRSEFLASASAFSGIFQAAGYAKDQAADLSVHFVKLATDLSSLANIPVQEAMEKIQSGLAGEVRPLREVGVFMSENAIKAEAMRMGMKALGGELTEQQKIQARVSFITRGLAFANGDLANTANSLQNSVRGLAGRIQFLAETIGKALEPVAAAVFNELGTAVQALSLYWEDNKASVVAWAQTTVGAVGETAGAMGWFQRSIGFVADAFQSMKIAFFAVQSYVTAGISLIVKGFSSMAHALDFVVEKLSGYKAGLGDFIDTFGQDLDRLSSDQWKKFQTELAKPPASDGVNAYFERAKKQIAEVRKEAVKTGVDVTKITPANAAPAKAEAPKFASAMLAGSQEATNAILRARYGGGAAAKGPEEQTAKNTARTNEILGQIAGALGAGGGPIASAGLMAGAALAANF